MTAPNNICIYADPFPDGELHCLAYSEAKYPNGKMNMHFPVCSNKNCPLRNPKLLNGGKLNDKKKLSGWLAPNGDFTPVFWGEPDGMSEKLCSMLGLEEFFLPDEELIKRGWLRISYTYLKGGPVINIGMRETTHFTESQKNFLRPYFEDREHYEFFAYLYDIWEEENEH